jgi:hypothetical protein
MHYTSTTPPDLDHVLNVIGQDRFIANFGSPVSEWGLTEEECERIKHGSHGQRAVYLLDKEVWGFRSAEWHVECECGVSFSDRLLSVALKGHDDHTGNTISHTMTAQLLEK